MYDYITQGAIIRSRATWYELGEKNNKYFLNLKKSNKKKSSVRKIFTRDSKLTNDPKKIMDELESFYANLYDGSSRPLDLTTPMFLDISMGFPALTDDLRKICEGKIVYSECFSVLGTFPKNKTLGGETTKLSLFADDITCFLHDKESHTSLFATLESFGSCSGRLRVNHEKTEVIALGSIILHEKDFKDHKICEIIKILGVYFGYDEKQRNDLNFRQTLKSIKKSIHMWKWRNLSILGKIQIIKTFAIPKLMFRASVIPIPNELVKEVNSIFYTFIWNGKDKVKRSALISDIDKGGLKILDIESMVSARRVICLKKFLEDYPSTWKSFLNSCIFSVGGSQILHCNFDTVKLKTQFPKYCKECFDAW